MDREFIGVAQAFGASGCMFGSRIAVTVASNSTVYLNAGAWIVECDSHTVCKFTYDAGTNWVTIGAASTAFVVPSDGFSVAFVGDGTGGSAHRSQILNWQ